MNANTLHVRRNGTVLKPDQSRVLLRPFSPGDSQRVARIMTLPEETVGVLLEQISAEFSQRRYRIHRRFRKRFEQVREMLVTDAQLSEQRCLLIGSYFLAEYSLESAALFNPSMAPHPDQTGLPAGALRFISFRATGEGHISSITFRSGIIHPDRRLDVMRSTGFLAEPCQIPNPEYDKPLFMPKLVEPGLTDEFPRRVVARLSDPFTLQELRGSIDFEMDQEPHAEGVLEKDQTAAQGIWLLAKSNYEVQFQSTQPLPERILFPATSSQRNGIEDAGVPVIAMNLGSCGEVIEDGQTGFLVNTVNKAAEAAKELASINGATCRARIQQYFSADSMVDAYERDAIFDLESRRRS